MSGPVSVHQFPVLVYIRFQNIEPAEPFDIYHAGQRFIPLQPFNDTLRRQSAQVCIFLWGQLFSHVSIRLIRLSTAISSMPFT